MAQVAEVCRPPESEAATVKNSTVSLVYCLNRPNFLPWPGHRRWGFKKRIRRCEWWQLWIAMLWNDKTRLNVSLGLVQRMSIRDFMIRQMEKFMVNICIAWKSLIKFFFNITTWSQNWLRILGNPSWQRINMRQKAVPQLHQGQYFCLRLRRWSGSHSTRPQ